MRLNRREFVQQGLLGSAVLASLSTEGFTAPGDDRNQTDRGFTAKEVYEHLRSLGAAWVDPQKTVDTFKADDPNAVVRGIAVGWMSYFESLRKAHELGCNLFVTHEPTYYDNFDRDPSVFTFEAARKKKAFINESGMVIVRCHDVWDHLPTIGIHDAWAQFLGLENRIAARSMDWNGSPSPGPPVCSVYAITPVKAAEFARMVAGKLVPLGQNAVLFVGPEDKIVRSVAIGTGAVTPFRQMVQELKADLAICTDDDFCYWKHASLAIDMGYPVIVVNHACSEEPGIQRLAEHLAEKFRPVPVHHIPQKCMFKCLGAS